MIAGGGDGAVENAILLQAQWKKIYIVHPDDATLDEQFSFEDKANGMTFLPDPPHGWNDTHAAWNLGRHDQWVPNKGLSAMTYHQRADIPFHYALADAFTLCDAYHCSMHTGTIPNRLFYWTGTNGPSGANVAAPSRQARRACARRPANLRGPQGAVKYR